ncbi:unnamed protein product [Adineta steineri]|uniref:Uncharacterized protein n=1 Tax=Adineta steineri TaxID=433720 RepID=A0A815J7J6_9BILA|nr:unnamed protein product [Adineta steineri]CAF1374301.1 unnamed protein product [Adineta steineri]
MIKQKELIYFFLEGAAEEKNDHLAARLVKSVQNAHRIAGYLYIIELAYSVGFKYLSFYEHFPSDGKVTPGIVERVENLFTEYFLKQNGEDIQHCIALDIVERCRDLITRNIEQYKLGCGVVSEPISFATR